MTDPDTEAGGDVRGNCLQLWREDADAILELTDAERHELTDALLAWFCRGEKRKASHPAIGWFLSQLERKQETAAKDYARRRKAQADGGRAAMRRRWHGADKSLISPDKSLISPDKSPCNENENENRMTENENETNAGARGAPSVSSRFSDSFSIPTAPPTVADLFSDAPTDAAINALISRVTDALGDEKPSVHKWRAFIKRHGARAFIDVAHNFMDGVRDGKEVTNRGAYLNALLDRYEG